MNPIVRALSRCLAGVFCACYLVRPAQGQLLPTAAPQEVGFAPERLAEIDAWMQRYVEEGKLAGIVALVARHGKVAYFEQVGWQDREAQAPMQPHTLFRIASMSKPITSVAVLMLYDDGLLDLDDPVSQYIPAFAELRVYVPADEHAKLERAITVRDLLMHTAGLTYGIFDNTPVDSLYLQAGILDLEQPVEEMVAKLVELPLLYQPGTVWHYSIATYVLAYLVEAVSQMPFDAFVTRRILEPLQMQDTDFSVPPEKQDRLAALYEPGSDGGLQVIPATSGTSERRLFGGGGMVSTAADYLRFAHMLLNGGALDGARLLRPETVALMTTNQLPEALTPIPAYRFGPVGYVGYGFGLGVGVLLDVEQAGIPGSVGMYRWPGAYSTHFWVDPAEEVIGLFLTQFSPVGTYPLEQEFQALVYQALDVGLTR